MRKFPFLAFAVVASLATGGTLSAVVAKEHSKPMGSTEHSMEKPRTPLTMEQARAIVDGRLAQWRSELKSGKVTEKDPNTYEIELLKPDGSLDRVVPMDKITGHHHRFNDKNLPPLTMEQARAIVAGRLAMKRSELKIGKITEKDANTYSVELLKADGTVEKVVPLDKLNGWHHNKDGKKGNRRDGQHMRNGQHMEE